MELTTLQRVAQQYRDEGYEVTLDPTGDVMPSFLTGFHPDLIARRGKEGVVAEVTHKRIELAENPRLTVMADQINQQPGWRLDVIVLEHETAADQALFAGIEPEDYQLGSMIATAEEMAASGFTQYAYVAALSGLEAVLRHLCQEAELYPHRTAIDCLRSIYMIDLLSRDQFIAIRDALKLRNQIVHGLVPPALEAESISFLTQITRTLLYGVNPAEWPAKVG